MMKKNINNLLTNFINSINEQQQATDKLISFLKDLQANAGNTKLQPIIDTLKSVKPVLTDLQNRLTRLNEAGLEEVVSLVTTLLEEYKLLLILSTDRSVVSM